MYNIVYYTCCKCGNYSYWPFLQTKFEELQPDSVNAQVLKYAKTIYQLEKGLPPNGVVPRLKTKVEDMKDKVWSINFSHPVSCCRYWLNTLGNS